MEGETVAGAQGLISVFEDFAEEITAETPDEEVFNRLLGVPHYYLIVHPQSRCPTIAYELIEEKSFCRYLCAFSTFASCKVALDNWSYNGKPVSFLTLTPEELFQYFISTFFGENDSLGLDLIAEGKGALLTRETIQDALEFKRKHKKES